MSDWIPEPLRALGPGGLAWWQWIGLAVAVPLAIVLGRLAATIIQRVVMRLTARTSWTFDDELFEAFGRPLRLFGAVAALRGVLELLELPHRAHAIGMDILQAAFAFAVVLSVLRAIDLFARRVGRAQWAVARPASRSVIMLFTRAAKAVVVIIAIIGVLGGLGLPVSSVLAGLGIGGIALAFGAQKTVENLFGAVAIGVDQPLREGDFVHIEGLVLGTVEAVGLRSSRIRTLDRTVVTLPNGKLSDSRIESFAPRDRCRLFTTLRLAYTTTPDQLRAILVGVESVLRAHPQLWPDDLVVRFASFGVSALEVEVIAYFATGDINQFRAYRQEVLLGFMDTVHAAGTTFAPAHTVGISGPVSPDRL